MDEFSVINKYFNWCLKDESVIKGVGDDAAIIENKGYEQIVISTDTLVENIHFKKGTNADFIAYKSLAVNLSDLAAMGAKPKWFTLAITMPEINEKWLDDFSLSLKNNSLLYNINLIGGNISKGNLSITITIIGVVANKKYLSRHKAKLNDDIYISGTIGNAGLSLINNTLYKPMPRIDLGLALLDLANSCIDISDGLLADMKKLLNNNLGVDINIKDLPLKKDVYEYVTTNNNQDLPLISGEDYELCFSVVKEKREQIYFLAEKLDIKLTRIGVVTNNNKINVIGYNFDKNQILGYKHF